MALRVGEAFRAGRLRRGRGLGVHVRPFAGSGVELHVLAGLVLDDEAGALDRGSPVGLDLREVEVEVRQGDIVGRGLVLAVERGLDGACVVGVLAGHGRVIGDDDRLAIGRVRQVRVAGQRETAVPVPGDRLAGHGHGRLVSDLDLQAVPDDGEVGWLVRV